MSLYNALFGTNPFAGMLLKLYELETEKYPTGRFRDIYVKKEKDKFIVVLYTRNGGGNREYYEEVFEALSKHPNYFQDYDDDFDSTYASIEFSVPKEKIEIIEHIQSITGSKEPMEKFKEMLDNMQKGNTEDPTVKNALEVGKQIFGKIEEKIKKNESGKIEI